MIIHGGLVALPGEASLARADIRVRGGRIAALGPALTAESDEEVIDAAGLEVFPGAIDPHVHFDTPGFEHREDFIHGSMAAARGGVATVIDMPCTSLPPVTTLANLREKLRAVQAMSVVDFALYGGVEGVGARESIDRHMAELAPWVVGYKCYFLSGMRSFPQVNPYAFSLAVSRAASLARPLLLHAEDPAYVEAATAAIAAKSEHAESPAAGAQSERSARWSDYVETRPEAAEVAAAAAALAYAAENAGTLHVVHVGTAEAAERLAAGGATCETCAHYLAFSSADFERLGSALKTAPPVKAPGQAARLWQLLAGGKIAFVASDHAPAPVSEKRTGSVWTDYGGIPGTGTLFPYLYSEGYRSGRLSLSRFVSAVAGAAAARYGLDARKGSIAIGKDADFALVDPAATQVVRGAELLSKGTITPFEGMRLRGAVVKTIVRGRIVWDAAIAGESGIRVSPGYGAYLQWGCM